MKKKEEQVDKETKKNRIKQLVKDIIKPSHMVVDFGNSSIKVIYGHFSKKNIEIFGYDILPINKELVDDGKILNPLEVASILRNSINNNQINVKSLTLVLSGSDIIIREIQIPKADDKEVGKIIEFEAQQYFPIELTEYKTDYKILEEIRTEEEEKLRILLVAVPIEQVKEYLDVSEYLGISLDAIDLVINTSLKYLLGNNYLKDLKLVESDEYIEDIKLKDLFKLDIRSLDDVKRIISSLIRSRRKQKTENEDDESNEEEPSKIKERTNACS